MVLPAPTTDMTNKMDGPANQKIQKIQKIQKLDKSKNIDIQISELFNGI